MKSVFFILLSLFLVNGSNNFVRSGNYTGNPQSNCTFCESTPCQCEKLTSEESCYKIAIKKLINLFLKKVNCRYSDPSTGTDCAKWCERCSKDHRIAKLLTEILGICKCNEDEDSIREVLEKLLDPSVCEKVGCRVHCDPHVQEVLRALLKKAKNKRDEEPFCPPSKEYKYWFKASKEAMRKEFPQKVIESKSDDGHARKLHHQDSCTSEIIQKNDGYARKIQHEDSCKSEIIQKNNKYKNVYKRPYESEKKKLNQRPKSLLCPRYVTDDRGSDFFSICADCNECRIVLSDRKCFAALFCEDCSALNSPFVQFTRNGYPVRREPEMQSGVKIKTQFLQINDFRPEEEKKQEVTVYNPFRPKNNIPRKTDGNGTKKKSKLGL